MAKGESGIMNNFWIGCLVTIICALIPFCISSYQLYRESKKMRKTMNYMIRGIEDSGLAKYRRNEKGEIVGMVLEGSVLKWVHAAMKAKTNEPRA
jgi:hypothetical protein